MPDYRMRKRSRLLSAKALWKIEMDPLPAIGIDARPPRILEEEGASIGSRGSGSNCVRRIHDHLKLIPNLGRGQGSRPNFGRFRAAAETAHAGSCKNR